MQKIFRRRNLLSIRYRKHDPKHVPYHPNSAQYHCGQDNLYPIDAGAQRKSPQQLYPKMKQNHTYMKSNYT